MRAGRYLRGLASARRQVRRMNEMDRVVREHVNPEPTAPETFYATSGQSQVEKGGDRWMPHDYRPIVGFTPNRTFRDEGGNRG